MNNCIICTAIALLCFIDSPALPVDPFNYFVEVKNFKLHADGKKISRYRLSSSAEDFTLIETHYQKIIKRYTNGGRKTVEIQTGGISQHPQTNESVAEYLVNTRYLNLDSPEINQARKQFQLPVGSVSSIEEYVYGHITDKVLGIPMMTAAQIYKNRQGDCTEHSVLSVAMLRKLGIPARAVVGMYLTDTFMGKKNVFVYHMWVEAFHRGRWHLVDATQPGEKRLNRYIAFAYHNLKTEAPLTYLRAISAIQEFTAEYIDD